MNDQRGLTYIEAIFATAIFVSIVLAVATTITQAGNTSWLRLGAQMDGQLQMQVAMDRLTDELRAAIIQGAPKPSPNCSAQSVRFVQYVAPPTDPPAPYITYSLNNDQQLIRQVEGNPDQAVVARGLRTFQPTCGPNGLVQLLISSQAKSAVPMAQRSGWTVTQQLVSDVVVKSHP